MQSKAPRLDLWSRLIVDYIYECGYMNSKFGFIKDGINIQLDPRVRSLRVSVGVNNNDIDYEISSSSDCVSFCELLKAIETLKSGY